MKTLKPIVLFMIMSIAGYANAADYIIDSEGAHASIDFKFKHLGYSWLTGSFRTFGGNFKWDKNKPEDSSITVDINVISLDSNQAERDKHIRGAKYLNVEKYPTAKFVSTSVTPEKDGSLAIHGNLTLHGITKEIVIDAKPVGEGKDPWGGYRAGFEGFVTLNTQDFGMPNFLPTNKVYMQLNIEGIRQ